MTRLETPTRTVTQYQCPSGPNDLVEYRADGLVAEYHSLAPCGCEGFVSSIRRESDRRILDVGGHDDEASAEAWCLAELRRRA